MWKSVAPRVLLAIRTEPRGRHLSRDRGGGPHSASRPRFGEFYPDRPLAAPNHVDFAEIARSIDLQREGVGHLDVFLYRPHLGSALGDVDDLAVDHRENPAGIGPGANV